MRASYLRVITDVVSSRKASSENTRLSKISEALLHIVENDANQRHRVMAVQTLQAIGPEYVGEKQYAKAMSRLHTLAERGSSEEMRRAVASAINRFKSS